VSSWIRDCVVTMGGCVVDSDRSDLRQKMGDTELFPGKRRGVVDECESSLEPQPTLRL